MFSYKMVIFTGIWIFSLSLYPLTILAFSDWIDLSGSASYGATTASAIQFITNAVNTHIHEAFGSVPMIKVMPQTSPMWHHIHTAPTLEWSHTPRGCSKLYSEQPSGFSAFLCGRRSRHIEIDWCSTLGVAVGSIRTGSKLPGSWSTSPLGFSWGGVLNGFPDSCAANQGMQPELVR